MNTNRLTLVAPGLTPGDEAPLGAGSAAGFAQPQTTVSTAAASHVERLFFMTEDSMAWRL